MSLEAGATNNRYFYAFDLDGSVLTGDASNFSVSSWKNGAVNALAPAVTEPVASSGRYEVAIDLSASANDVEADWVFEISTTTTSDGPWILRDRAFRGTLADAGIARKALVNRLEVSDTNDEMKLYDDDDSVLLTHALLDKDGSAISVSTGVPSRRAKGV